MMLYKRLKIRSYETGLYFRDGEFKGLLGEGRHWLFDPLMKVRVDVANMRDAWIAHEKLDVIVRSGALKDRAIVMDLKDHQRCLVWIDGRFAHLLAPGLYAYWNGPRDVSVEVIDARQVRFEHRDLKVIAATQMAKQLLDICTVNRNCVGVLFIDGRFVEVLRPGLYAFWKGAADARVVEIDMRETTVDVSGQEIMTSDKVSLRMNAMVTYRIADAREGGQLDGRRPPGTVPRDADGGAGRGRRSRARCFPDGQGRRGSGDRAGGSPPRGRDGSGGCIGRYPRRDPAGRHEGPDEQGHGGQEGRRGQPHLSPRGNGRHAQPGEHGQAAGRQPDADATAGTGSPGEDRIGWPAEGRAW